VWAKFGTITDRAGDETRMDLNRTDDRPVEPRKPDPPKRAYHAPRLIVHGTVAELTASQRAGRQLFAPIYLTEA